MGEIKLNEEQQKVLEYFKEDPKKLGYGRKLILTGSAGTGKTTTLVELLKMLKEQKRSVQILTPTHQSSIVIHNMLSEQNIKGVNITTIHSYFEIRPDINEFGERIFVPKLRDMMISADFFIIDEISMIDKDLFWIINKYLKNFDILFIGDPYQLPPVKETRSPIFDEPYDRIVLKKILRTKNDLFEIFEKVRFLIKEYEENKKKAPLSEIVSLIDHFHVYGEFEFNDFFNKFLEHRFGETILPMDSVDLTDSTESFSNEKRIKIGSFTNNFVNYYNIHFRRFDPEVKNPDELYSKGDKLIFNAPYNYIVFSNNSNELTDRNLLSTCNIFTNGEETKVIKEPELVTFTLNKIKEFQEVIDRLRKILPDYLASLKDLYPFLFEDNKASYLLKPIKFNAFLLTAENKSKFLVPLGDGSKEDLFPLYKEAVFDIAKTMNNQRKISKNSKKNFWKFAYNFNDLCADVTYAYASTIHKLQGQTLDEVFIDLRDFINLYETDYNLFLRLLYVGITRTKNNVFVLK